MTLSLCFLPLSLYFCILLHHCMKVCHQYICTRVTGVITIIPERIFDNTGFKEER